MKQIFQFAVNTGQKSRFKTSNFYWHLFIWWQYYKVKYKSMYSNISNNIKLFIIREMFEYFLQLIANNFIKTLW